MSRRTVALLSVIALMAVWGSTFVVTKTAVSEIPPLSLATLRFAIAASVLLPLGLARGGLRALPQPLPLASLVMMAATGIGLFHIAFNLALVYGSASQGALIFALVPAAVSIAAVLFLAEKLARRRVLGIALSVFGVAVVVVSGERSAQASNPLVGAWWMLGAVAAWAVYTVFAKRLAAADQVVVVACITVIGVLLMLPFALWELGEAGLPSPSLFGWLGALFLGVIASAVAFVVYGYVLRELEASLVGIFVNLDPVVGVLTAALFLGETLRPFHLVGGSIAIAGMWLAAEQV